MHEETIKVIQENSYNHTWYSLDIDQMAKYMQNVYVQSQFGKRKLAHLF